MVVVSENLILGHLILCLQILLWILLLWAFLVSPGVWLWSQGLLVHHEHLGWWIDLFTSLIKDGYRILCLVLITKYWPQDDCHMPSVVTCMSWLLIALVWVLVPVSISPTCLLINVSWLVQQAHSLYFLHIFRNSLTLWYDMLMLYLISHYSEFRCV